MSIPKAVPARLHDLYAAAERARANAYAPYSKFTVGAAIRTRDGRVFAGTNVENGVNGASVCAERGAVQAAVAESGKIELVEVLVLTGSTPPAAPCGVCRQVLAEFSPKDLGVNIHAVNPAGEFRTVKLSELLPQAFRLE